MFRYLVILIFINLIAATPLPGSSSGKEGEPVQPPVDSDIADVRNLPQEIGAYASSFRDGYPGKMCRDYYLAEFRRKYYSPWTGNVPVTSIPEAMATMQGHLQRVWYAENKRRVSGRFLEELAANCDLEHFPSLHMPAIATATADMRVLPTTKPFFENADDFPFDALQNTSVKLNEPLRVLHISRDALWVFVETADTSGWVQAREIGYLDETLAKKWMERPQIVITRDLTLIREKSGQAQQRVKVGTICPLVGVDGHDFEIAVAAKAGYHQAVEITAKVAQEAAGIFPLELNRSTVTLIGDELVSKPYGWGEKYLDRDCSAMIRDFFLPFGIWLPRGSYNQIHSGRTISLSGLSGSEKERLIMEKGVPFLTLVYVKGHIMIYIGNRNGRPLIFHSTWGISVRDGKGGEYKKIIGKSIVSTLNPGAELDLAVAPLLEKVTSILVLGDNGACVKQTDGSRE
ncbi:MAG TPA: SH3 domain-containing protein [Geobacteraceae bacterium]|nr:SH3 domain-containing protein [Geobacteraceae bacterium]